MRSLLATLSLLATITLVGASCASTPSAGEGDATAASGERLYRSRCAACHRLRDPAELTAARWAWAVEKYGKRARLSPGQRHVVLEYLTAHAKDAPMQEEKP